jgi:hypothetical protein
MDKSDADVKDLTEYIFKDLQKSKKLYFQPERKVLTELFNCLYFASMNSEEGELIKVRVAFYNPKESDLSKKSKSLDRWNYIPFDEPRPFDIKTTVKLSKSVDPWSSSLAVFYDDDNKLWIYGLIDQAVHSESFLNRETSSKPDQAGLFQVSITGIGCLSVIREYDLVATLKQNILVTEFVDVLRFGPIARLLKAKSVELKKEIGNFVQTNNLGFGEERSNFIVENMLRDTISRLLIHVRNYRHGGALLITEVSQNLKINYSIDYKRLYTSMIRLVKLNLAYNHQVYRLNEVMPKSVSAKLISDFLTTQEAKKSSENELKGAIRFIASHSCVDGLILLNDHFEEMGYGVVIQQISLPDFIYQATDNLATENKLEQKVPTQFGTRHQSLISFCWANPNAVGFVISQDGDIRAFTRVEDKLIMWENIKTHRYFKLEPVKRRGTTTLKSV